MLWITNIILSFFVAGILASPGAYSSTENVDTTTNETNATLPTITNQNISEIFTSPAPQFFNTSDNESFNTTSATDTSDQSETIPELGQNATLNESAEVTSENFPNTKSYVELAPHVDVPIPQANESVLTNLNFYNSTQQSFDNSTDFNTTIESQHEESMKSTQDLEETKLKNSTGKHLVQPGKLRSTAKRSIEKPVDSSVKVKDNLNETEDNNRTLLSAENSSQINSEAILSPSTPSTINESQLITDLPPSDVATSTRESTKCTKIDVTNRNDTDFYIEKNLNETQENCSEIVAEQTEKTQMNDETTAMLNNNSIADTPDLNSTTAMLNNNSIADTPDLNSTVIVNSQSGIAALKEENLKASRSRGTRSSETKMKEILSSSASPISEKSLKVMTEDSYTVDNNSLSINPSETEITESFTDVTTEIHARTSSANSLLEIIESETPLSKSEGYKTSDTTIDSASENNLNQVDDTTQLSLTNHSSRTVSEIETSPTVLSETNMVMSTSTVIPTTPVLFKSITVADEPEVTQKQNINQDVKLIQAYKVNDSSIINSNPEDNNYSSLRTNVSELSSDIMIGDSPKSDLIIENSDVKPEDKMSTSNSATQKIGSVTSAPNSEELTSVVMPTQKDLLEAINGKFFTEITKHDVSPTEVTSTNASAGNSLVESSTDITFSSNDIKSTSNNTKSDVKNMPEVATNTSSLVVFTEPNITVSTLSEELPPNVGNSTIENIKERDGTNFSSTDITVTTPTPPIITSRSPRIRKPRIRDGAGFVSTAILMRKSTTPRPKLTTAKMGGTIASIFRKDRTRLSYITSSTTPRTTTKYNFQRAASYRPISIVGTEQIPLDMLPPMTTTVPSTTTEEEEEEEEEEVVELHEDEAGSALNMNSSPTYKDDEDVTLIKIAAATVVVKGLRWRKELHIRQSPQYKKQEQRLRKTLERIFRGSSLGPNLWKLEIDGFIETFTGSRRVIVDYSIYFVKTDDPLKKSELVRIFNERLVNSTFSRYTFDPAFTQFDILYEERLNEPTQPPELEPPIPQWAIAVVVIGAASFIFIVLFAAVTVYGRHHSRRRYASKLDDDTERSVESKEWEKKLGAAAAYENLAADVIYDAEDSGIDKKSYYLE